MRSHRSEPRGTDPWDQISGPLGAAVWCLATMAFAYGLLFVTFVLGLIVTNGGVRLPPPPPGLALPVLPKSVNLVLIAGPLALAGGVVLGPSRWWVGIAGGVGLGALSGALLYLSDWHRQEITVFAPIAWVLAGYLGAVIGQFRRELRRGSASRTTGAGAGAEPEAE